MPTDRKSPLLGYNHNLQYKGRLYHVQTEDSGLSSPHIFTHLFFDGTILATKKTTYDHILQEKDRDDRIRKLMQEQHKNMMKELLHGLYDERIFELLGSLSADSIPQEIPAVAEPAPQAQSTIPRHPVTTRPPQPPPPSEPAQHPSGPQPPPSMVPPPLVPQNTPDGRQEPSAPSHRRPTRIRLGGGARSRTNTYDQQRSSVVVSAPVVVLTDIGSSPVQTGTRTRSTTIPRLPQNERDALDARDREQTGPREKMAADTEVVFKPEESQAIPSSVFGDEGISEEKSLDEVILAYLKEDLPDE